MDRVAFNLGFIQVYWYSIFIFLGVFFAGLVIIKESKKQDINQEFLINLIFYGIIFGLIGARLYYVAFNLDYYLKYPLEILEVWNGGMAIHGGLIAGLITVAIYCKKNGYKVIKLLDIIVVGLILGQAIGRWGNFFNGEAYGPITTFEHLKGLHLPDFIINGMFIDGAYRTPTFLYESLLDFIGFIVLVVLRHNKYLKNGWLTSIYLIWYSTTRIFIEALRTDSLMLGNFKVAQIVSGLGIVIGIFLFIKFKKGTKFDNLYNQKKENPQPVYQQQAAPIQQSFEQPQPIAYDQQPSVSVQPQQNTFIQQPTNVQPEPVQQQPAFQQPAFIPQNQPAKFCPNCGTQANADATFCPNCGNSI